MKIIDFLFKRTSDLLRILGNRHSTYEAAASMLGLIIMFWLNILVNLSIHYLDIKVDRSEYFIVFIVGAGVMLLIGYLLLKDGRYKSIITPKSERGGIGYYLGAIFIGLLSAITVWALVHSTKMNF